MTLLEKAARILEALCENIELDNIESMHVNQTGKKIKYKNQELADFSNLVYRLVHAGLCSKGLNSCGHKDWEDEVEQKYRELVGNDNCPEN